MTKATARMSVRVGIHPQRPPGYVPESNEPTLLRPPYDAPEE